MIQPADPDSPAAPALEIRGLRKTYRGGVEALRGVDMRLERGEIFGLLGPNGAGKSTLVKILMTVVSPSGGDGTLLGRPLGSHAALSRVGYLPEHHRFPDYLTGAQVLDIYGGLSDVSRQERRRRSGELLELVGMTAWARQRVRKYSKGMRQRLGIAQALVNNPDLVVLDEPTDGVDPVGRREIRGIVQRLRAEGRTVLINSHLLSELEMVCDRVAIMVQGLVRRQGSLDELTDGELRYEFAVAPEPGDTPETLLDLLSPLLDAGSETPALAGEGERVLIEDGTVVVATGRAERVQPVLDRLRAAGRTVVGLGMCRPSLEDLFMRAVTDPETGQTRPIGAGHGEDDK